MLIVSSPLKTQLRKRIEANANANYIGKTDRCLYTRIKEHPLMTLLKYISMLSAVMNSIF